MISVSMSGQQGHRTLNKDAIKALRRLFEDFETQLQYQDEGCDDSTSDEEQRRGTFLRKGLLILLPYTLLMKKVMNLLQLESHSSICVMIGFSQWQQ